MITQKEAVQRLFNTYGEYGITEDILNQLFEDGVKNQHFTPQETYNLLRMSLGHEFGGREYFAVPEIADMLGMTEEEVIAAAQQAKAGNEAMKATCKKGNESKHRQGKEQKRRRREVYQ